MFASAALPSLGSSGGVAAQQPDMTFFVTSVGPGRGADLGGLAGADAHRRRLAAAVGAGSKTWRAYLGTNAAGGSLYARDRCGGEQEYWWAREDSNLQPDRYERSYWSQRKTAISSILQGFPLSPLPIGQRNDQ